MKNKIIVSILLIILVVVGFIGFVNFKLYRLEKDVQAYLISKGYKNDEIESITTHFAKVPVYSARVIFSDETNVIYYYLDEDGIRQFGTPTDVNGRNIDLQFKHQEPYK
ncbi:DUF3139 domain-containing protein [uncultured Brevibacillus sp.]|uniref:DUF3139 domain-containing protein n=1 Tax=uncultured Brevibacillus sp. TaxID=169970 RepID=UPI002594E242|nr:DUF3139 domain-containing protein [uncultured Brevibacillus sp.]